MSVNPHAGVPPVTAGVALAEAAVVAVLTHGRDQGPETMLELVEHLDLDGVHYVLPVAAGRSWYPARLFDPPEANEPMLSFALEAFGAVLARLGDRGWPPERLALAGFSQGACITLEYVARHPRHYGAVAGLTGSLIGPDRELTRPPSGSLRGTPLLITTAEQDEWIPVYRTRESASVLEAAGAAVDLRIMPPGEHGIEDEEVEALRRLLRAEAA
jgi:phospholipase/carboxylesterase